MPLKIKKIKNVEKKKVHIVKCLKKVLKTFILLEFRMQNTHKK